MTPQRIVPIGPRPVNEKRVPLRASLDDSTIAIRPTRWLTWDMSRFLETLAAGGVDLAPADTWFTTGE